MICTNRYVEKANQGDGGVGYEKMIVTSNLMKNINENKVIPIIRQSGTYNVPTFLKTKLFIDLSKEDEIELKFDELLRRIHNSPLFVKPQIGVNPFVNANNLTTSITQIEESSNNSINQLLVAFHELYEEDINTDIFSFREIFEKLEMRKIYLDIVIKEALKRGLIKKGSQYFELTDAGKLYIINNRLI